MADTISTYNHTSKKLLQLSMVDEAANFYVELLDATATFVATETTKTAVDNAGAKEVYDNGWTQGGENLTNVAVTTVNTDDAMIDADNIVVTATGGSIGPASAALIYVNEGAGGVTYSPLWYVTFDAAKTATVGNDFSFTINASGLARVAVV